MIDLFKGSRSNAELVRSTFSRFVRFQDLTRFLVLYELFGKVLNIQVSLIEIGVLNGFNVFSLAHFCEILEPRNYTRKIYDFDTFSGYESVAVDKDGALGEGELSTDFKCWISRTWKSRLRNLTKASNSRNSGKSHFLGDDAVRTIPNFVSDHPQTVVALLICYTDSYAPTKAALEHFWPRMPKGGIVFFCTTNFDHYPGETMAFHEVLGIANYRLHQFPFATKFSYIVKE